MNLQISPAQIHNGDVSPFLSPLSQFFRSSINCLCVNILIILNGTELLLVFLQYSHYWKRLSSSSEYWSCQPLSVQVCSSWGLLPELLRCGILRYLILHRWCLVTKPLPWYNLYLPVQVTFCMKVGLVDGAMAVHKCRPSWGKLNHCWTDNHHLSRLMSTSNNRSYSNSFPSTTRISNIDWTPFAHTKLKKFDTTAPKALISNSQHVHFLPSSSRDDKAFC